MINLLNDLQYSFRKNITVKIKVEYCLKFDIIYILVEKKTI
jgi:hypothetical protein